MVYITYTNCKKDSFQGLLCCASKQSGSNENWEDPLALLNKVIQSSNFTEVLLHSVWIWGKRCHILKDQSFQLDTQNAPLTQFSLLSWEAHPHNPLAC